METIIMGIPHSKKCEVLPDIRILIKSEPIVIFITTYSMPCFASIELMKSLTLMPFIVNLDQELHISSIRQALFHLAGQYELPIIFIKGAFFGSYKELKKAIAQKTFQSLLRRNKIKFEEVDYDELSQE